MRNHANKLALFSLLIFAGIAHATVVGTSLTVSFTCTGTTGPFPFTFPISSPTALTVTQNGTVLSPSVYSVVPVNNNYDNGGSVTLNSACPASQPLVLTRITPILQTTVYADNMPVPMATIENSFDYLTEIEQEQTDSLHGLWMLPIYSSTVPSGNCSPPDQVEYVTTTSPAYAQYTCVAQTPPALPQWQATGTSVAAGTGCAGGNSLANGCTGGNSQLTANGSLGSTGPEINVASTTYGAVGDCAGGGSTASCTDNCTPLTNVYTAARLANSPVYFPVNPAMNGPTVYYTSCTINPQGVSFHGPTGSAGQSQVNTDGMLVSVRGAPGKDVFAVPDPGASAPVLLSKGYAVSDIGINVDASVDASSSGTNSFPNRLPGRPAFDVVANGTTVITSASQAQFQPGDVGQAIKVNGVTTTIASWQSVNQVTLAATVTSGTALAAYISVDGLSATQTIGNCGFAMDASGLAGGYGSGPIRASFTNVVVQLEGSRTNNTCGYFFQGDVAPYQVTWNHDFVGGEYGFVFVPANTSAGQVGGAAQGIADFNEVDNTWVTATYPWISYGGNVDTIKAMQISAAIYGPSILEGNGIGGSTATPTQWNIDIPEIEDTGTCSGSAATNFRISGRGHKVDRLSTSYCTGGVEPTFQWDASSADINDLDLVGENLAVSGNFNTFRDPFFPVGLPASYSITGIGNTFRTCTSSNEPFGQQPGRCQYAGLINTGLASTTFGPAQLSRGSTVYDRKADFLQKGGLYYFNDEDQWIWPNEAMSPAVAVVPALDSTSDSGQAIVMSGTTSLNLYGSNGNQWFYGSQVPAGKVRFYVKAKANTSLSWSASLQAFVSPTDTTLCTLSPTLTTSYVVYSCDADATAYFAGSVYMNFSSPGMGNTINIAWVGIKPWFSDVEVNGPVNATSYQVAGAALATGNLADWTNSAVANGNVPVWNSGTGKWTPGAGPSGTFSALTGDATSTATGGATTVSGLFGHAIASLTSGFLQWNGTSLVWGSSTGPTLQTNGVNNTSQTALNFLTSSTNACGLTWTPSNPSAGGEQGEIAGTYTCSLNSSQVTTALGYTPANCTAGTSANNCAKLNSSGLLPLANLPDFPAPFIVPSANCVSGSPGSAWSTTIAPSCRAGTYNVGGNLPFADGNTAQFQIQIPADWDSTANAYARLNFTTGANTTGTIIFQVQLSCYTTGNTQTDDQAFATAQVFSTKTAAAANFANTVTLTLNSTSLTGCAAAGGMLVKITRNTDTAASVVPVTSAVITLNRTLANVAQ